MLVFRDNNQHRYYLVVSFLNHTFLGGGGGWMLQVGGDDDTFLVLSRLGPFLGSLDPLKPLFLGVPGPATSGRW